MAKPILQTSLLDRKHVAGLAINHMERLCITYESRVDWLLAFIHRVALDEIDACAKACDYLAEKADSVKGAGSLATAYKHAANVIRERSLNEGSHVRY